MAKKRNEYTKEERIDLAQRLSEILGADIDLDEEDTIWEAIRFISPEFAEAFDDVEQEAADWWDNTTDAEKDALVEEVLKEMEDNE